MMMLCLELVMRKAILTVRYGGCYVGGYNCYVKPACRGGNRDECVGWVVALVAN